MFDKIWTCVQAHARSVDVLAKQCMKCICYCRVCNVCTPCVCVCVNDCMYVYLHATLYKLHVCTRVRVCVNVCICIPVSDTLGYQGFLSGSSSAARAYYIPLSLTHTLTHRDTTDTHTHTHSHSPSLSHTLSLSLSPSLPPSLPHSLHT